MASSSFLLSGNRSWLLLRRFAAAATPPHQRQRLQQYCHPSGQSVAMGLSAANHIHHHQHHFFSTTTTSLNTTNKRNDNAPFAFEAANFLKTKFSLNPLDSFFLWNLQQPRKGTGFDNFIPRNKNEDEVKKEDGEGIHASKKEENSNEKPPNENPNNNNSSWPGMLFFLLLLALALQNNSNRGGSSGSVDDESSADGGSSGNNRRLHDHREISWQEFLRLLQQQQVLKIVVTNDERQTARVYVRSPPAASASLNSASSWKSYEERRRLQQAQQQQGAVSNNTNNNNSTGNGEPQSPEFSTNTTITMTAADTDDVDDMNLLHTTSGSSHRQIPPHLMYYRLQMGSIEAFERKLEDAQRALNRDPAMDIPVQYTADSSMVRELLAAVPGLILAALLFGMMRFAATGGMSVGGRSGGSGGAGGRGGMGGIFQIGKSTAKKIAKEDVNVTFADVAGCDEAKKEIMEFVDFLKDAEPFTRLGAKIPKGALLCGPPGTGKTLLAKAVAGEAGVPFYSISGSDFIEMFVGVGPSRVRDLFSEARANAPCIVFIDEIDAVGRQRGRGGMGGNDERENTLNQLLVEMDGFESTTGVVVLAGTNRVDILDAALTRPGRFDRQITVDKPDLNGRKAIFKVHLRGIKLQDEIEDIAGRLAGLTPGFAGADIANLCNEAAIVAARRKGDTVTLEDFEKATDRIIGGLESNKIMSKEERSIVAYHEAGHAVAGWFLEYADPLLKVTIIPRSKGALGFAQYLPKEVFLRTQEQIMDIVSMALAGRAAEEIIFGNVTTGASDDLRRVTDIVYSTIQLYGMNSRLGQLSFPKDPNAFYEERPYSEKTAKAMDEEARNTVDEAYQRTKKLLLEHRSDLEKVATMLLEKETITHDDMVEAIGHRPFARDPLYEEFITRRQQDKEIHDKDKTKEQEAEKDVPTEDAPPLNPGLA